MIKLSLSTIYEITNDKYNDGHIRVGLDDNVRMPNGELAKESYKQVQWAVQVAKHAGREVASPDEARQIFHIPDQT